LLVARDFGFVVGLGLARERVLLVRAAAGRVSAALARFADG